MPDSLNPVVPDAAAVRPVPASNVPSRHAGIPAIPSALLLAALLPALREAPGEAPMPAWYAEELRRQAPGYSRLIDAMVADELPPCLTGEARTLHLPVDAAARRRIDASAATWLDVRNQIEPALRPGSPDASLRKAAVTLEALGPMMVESSVDLARALHAHSRGDWQRLARTQWLLALALGLSAALLVARALLGRARVD